MYDSRSQINLCVMFLFPLFQPLVVDTLPYPFNEEIKGIASASGVPLGQSCSFKQTVFVSFNIIFHRINKNRGNIAMPMRFFFSKLSSLSY